MGEKEEHFCHCNCFQFVFVLQRLILTARIHLNLFNVDPLEENEEFAGKSMQSFWPSFRLSCEKCSSVLNSMSYS